MHTNTRHMCMWKNNSQDEPYHRPYRRHACNPWCKCIPSQIESVLLGVEEASAHYMIVVDRVNSQDKLTVQVELKEDVDMGDAAKLAAIASRIKTDIKQTLLISAKVELVPPKTIPRSEGKAKRITDNRHIGF